jgi:hypothetical protein
VAESQFLLPSGDDASGDPTDAVFAVITMTAAG